MQNEWSEGEWRPGSQHQERDYAAFNRIFDIVRSCFSTLHMGFANEERWRWDTPVITFSWEDGDERVSRNLNGLVLGETLPTGMQVDSNAWYDIREENQVIRFWRNFPMGRIDSTDQHAVLQLVQKAYEEVSECSKQQIERHKVLSNGDKAI